jgi:hypothetical protein
LTRECHAGDPVALAQRKQSLSESRADPFLAELEQNAEPSRELFPPLNVATALLQLPARKKQRKRKKKKKKKKKKQQRQRQTDSFPMRTLFFSLQPVPPRRLFGIPREKRTAGGR